MRYMYFLTVGFLLLMSISLVKTGLLVFFIDHWPAFSPSVAVYGVIWKQMFGQVPPAVGLVSVATGLYTAWGAFRARRSALVLVILHMCACLLGTLLVPSVGQAFGAFTDLWLAISVVVILIAVNLLWYHRQPSAPRRVRAVGVH
ncbi:MAG: hypothetical protein WBA12_00395 [Catalinimonas sp.]